MQEKAYFYSPFSETTIRQGKNNFLLLRFILSEMFQSALICREIPLQTPLFSKETFRSTLDTLSTGSPFNRLLEHTELLPLAFPSKSEEISVFKHSLSDAVFLAHAHLETGKQTEEFQLKIKDGLKRMFFSLAPLMTECKQDENFLFFLLQNHNEIALLSHKNYLPLLLDKLHPEGSGVMQKRLCDYFHNRGFPSLIPQVRTLLTILGKEPHE